ncbi:hypothetical protein TU94_25365 [Streptomyces cyaneogriseus subsp. noncyanogenus]|uniref:Uncharacterized protein n=1 Tax=Streptomyces cyaneogriseus subsp. noncyanogenus TaxID=477245 RepID=A0A0C5FW51_9ACTN|nr:hypothetical protein [Streptomyces cyaneogriseus]AJP04297.1 hypothetical protein TU94_25365 [Streptomyces cyaneogriseus subsp. noncyanogenus]
MAESGFDLPPKAPPEVVAERHELADEVCRQLTLAGLPAYRADLDGGTNGRAGAAVHIEPFVEGGVFVDWETDEELASPALHLFAQGIDYENPPSAVRHFEDVLTFMQAALMGILASAGFQVEEPDGHAHGSLVQVRSARKP